MGLLLVGIFLLASSHNLFAYADADADGIPDSIERGSGEVALNSDDDEIPDFLDTDSDNDGIPDRIEFPFLGLGPDSCTIQGANIKWNHNWPDDSGTWGKGENGVASENMQTAVVNIEDFAIGVGLRSVPNDWEWNIQSVDQIDFTGAKANGDYAELALTVKEPMLFTAIQQGMVPKRGGGFAAGNYNFAGEISDDNFDSATELFNDGFMRIPSELLNEDGNNDYAVGYHELTPVFLEPDTEYKVRLYYFNENNENEPNGMITVDDIETRYALNCFTLDADKDKMPDYRDKDADGDGISDQLEAGSDPENPTDTDDDGIPDFLETDSDGDGIPDAEDGPVVTTSAAPTANLANQADYPVTGTCSVNAGNVNVAIAGATPAKQEVFCSDRGIWSATFNVSKIESGKSVIQINASQTDAASRSGFAKLVQAGKDAVAPALLVTKPPVVNALNRSKYAVSGSCTAGDADVEVTISDTLDEESGGETEGSRTYKSEVAAIRLTSTTSCAKAGTFSATFNVAEIADGVGALKISAKQIDAAGNVGKAPLLEVDKDTIAPSLAILSAPAVNLVNSSAYPVSGTCSAGDGDVQVAAETAESESEGEKSRSASIRVVRTVGCSKAGSWAASLDLTEAPDGVRAIALTAAQTDLAGNVGRAVAINVDKDTTAPVIPTVESIAPDTGFSSTDGITNTVLPKISGAWNRSGATELEVAVAARTYVLGKDDELSSTKSGVWSLDLTALASPLNEGKLDVRVTSRDLAGNAVSDETTDEFVIDTTNPEVPTVDVLVTADPTPVVTGNAILADGEVLTVRVANATYIVVPKASKWRLDTATATISNGVLALNTGGISGLTRNPVVATVTDLAGNIATDVSINELTIDVDADKDGIPDAIEGEVDSDKDGSANKLDLDSDADGIPDAVERGTDDTDTDGDGILDVFDADADGNGVTDKGAIDENFDGVRDLVKPADQDEDGIPNYLDRDSDNDGVPDVIEGPGDTDMDGIPDSLEIDSDNDGITDAKESGVIGLDDDEDGIDNAFDADIDGDGVLDAGAEDLNKDGINDNANALDTDRDGIRDAIDVDADNDGIPDVIESAGDSDLDGTPDYLDTDSDNDGIPDSIEGKSAGKDSDGDGIDDAYDFSQAGGIDENFDGITDNAAPDADGDGIPNARDIDSDNDDIPDSIESGVSGVDSDKDGLDDFYDADDDNDGVTDVGSTDADENGVEDQPMLDTDKDGLPNVMDTDSDADGIPDTVESGAGKNDADRDAIVDDFDADADGDGKVDAGKADDNGDGVADTALTANNDFDALPNYLDIDSDNDGILDATESDTGTDSDADGIDDAYDADANGDGFLDEGATDSDADGVNDNATPTDTDSDSVPDYLDLDSDNDSLLDVQEAGLLDENFDGLLDEGANRTSEPRNSDGDKDADYRDLDSDDDGNTDISATSAAGLDLDFDGRIDDILDLDRDGIADVIDGEPGTFGTVFDVDLDGITNLIDLDDDNDGIPDIAEMDAAGVDIDTDGDNIVDRLDKDSDNDGIPDSIEARLGANDLDADGEVDNFTDSDQDGLDDNVSSSFLPENSDADSTPDFRDLDSDGDTLADVYEASGMSNALDLNDDGVLDSNVDADMDGLIDLVDPVVINGKSGAALKDVLADLDNDGLLNAQDPDSDNDGFDDGIEDGDFNNNGVLDSLENGCQECLEVGGGGGSLGWLVLLALMTVIVIRVWRTCQSIVQMVAILSLSIFAGNAVASDCGSAGDDFESCLYGTIGAVYADLSPEGVSNGWFTDGDNDTGFSLGVGWQFAENWFAEVEYADLGEAVLSNLNPNVTNSIAVGYEVYSAVLGYQFGNANNNWQPYIQAGAVGYNIDTADHKICNTDLGVQATAGFGIQYQPDNSNFFARGGADWFSTDAATVGLTIGGYFGGKSGASSSGKASKADSKSAPIVPTAEPDPAPTPDPEPAPTTVSVPVSELVAAAPPAAVTYSAPASTVASSDTAAATPEPAACVCGDSGVAIFNLPVDMAAKNITKLGSFPEFGNSHALSPTEFYEKLRNKFESDPVERKYLDYVWKSMGYSNGFAGATAEQFSNTVLERGTKGLLGFGEFHGYEYSQLNTSEYDRQAFHIQSLNGHDVHYMKTCGNYMYFCGCE